MHAVTREWFLMGESVLSCCWRVSHTKTSVIGASVQIPITRGRLNLGRWQGEWMDDRIGLTETSRDISDGVPDDGTHEEDCCDDHVG